MIYDQFLDTIGNNYKFVIKTQFLFGITSFGTLVHSFILSIFLHKYPHCVSGPLIKNAHFFIKEMRPIME